MLKHHFLNIFFLLKRGYFHSITYALGCLLIVAICIYYFYELFHYSRLLTLVQEPAFWICSGLLFFYSCSFPLFGLLNFVGDASRVIINNIDNILKLLNVMLYSIFTIAFLCRVRIGRKNSVS